MSANGASGLAGLIIATALLPALAGKSVRPSSLNARPLARLPDGSSARGFDCVANILAAALSHFADQVAVWIGHFN